MDGSESEPILIYYPITLTLVTRGCSSIKPTRSGRFDTDPLPNGLFLTLSLCYLIFTPLFNRILLINIARTGVLQQIQPQEST